MNTTNIERPRLTLHHFEPEHKMSIAERMEELEKENRRLQARVDELEAFERSRGEIAAGQFSTLDDLKAEVEAEEPETDWRSIADGLAESVLDAILGCGDSFCEWCSKHRKRLAAYEAAAEKEDA